MFCLVIIYKLACEVKQQQYDEYIIKFAINCCEFRDKLEYMLRSQFQLTYSLATMGLILMLVMTVDDNGDEIETKLNVLKDFTAFLILIEVT